MSREQEQGDLNYDAIWKAHGGTSHGPNVEHVSMEKRHFAPFCKALIDAASPRQPVSDEVSDVAARLHEACKMLATLADEMHETAEDRHEIEEFQLRAGAALSRLSQEKNGSEG